MSGKNSLSTLLRNYMSDSENENEIGQTSNSFSKEIGNLFDEISRDNCEEKSKLPKTEWTQCIDPNTGHPYYWNITTKEVTWEKPDEYEQFLNEIGRILKKIPNDSWVIGYSENSETPYYLNIFTREISWQKPTNFKEKKKSKKPKKRKHLKLPNENELVNPVKKKYPKNLESCSDEDVKIELISSFSNKSASSSDDEKKIASNSKLESDNQKFTKINLVAAYATDDEEEDCLEKPKENIEDVIKPNIESPETSQTSQKSLIIKSEKPQITSFASIITGGKIENEFDDEINKLKEELEKDLIKNQKDDETAEINETNTIKNSIDSSFDEKNFKRKRRIEFGTSGKSAQQNFDIDNDNDSRSSVTLAGYSEDSKDIIPKEANSNSKKLLTKKKLYSNFTRSHVEFLKVDEDKNEDQIDENDEIKNENEIEINELCDIIFGKVKFLSVGHSEVSTVQAMRIQLETLLAAFKCSSLKSDYFFKWLKQTSDDLLKLEQNAAPNGWNCKWDRTTAQYCYENLTTNEIRWEFPNTNETNSSKCSSAKDDHNEVENELLIENQGDELKKFDDVEGEIEMDISTTPPPNENEKIIVQHNWTADNAPPPPRITTPSPPAISASVIINDELSAFYSDIAKISSETSDQQPQTSQIENQNDTLNTSISSEVQNEKQQQLIERKKRKKAKVSGLSMGDKGVTEMVAKWQKAQQQKGYNFW